MPSERPFPHKPLGPLGADAGAMLRRFEEEPDITIRRALLLALGEYGEAGLPPGSRTALIVKFQGLYQSESDPGLHAAAGWLLRRWKQEPWLKQVNEQWAAKKVKGEGWWEEGKKPIEPATRHAPPTTPGWYVNGQGQTMVVVPGPVEFTKGAPPTEVGRLPGDEYRRMRIRRTFAIADSDPEPILPHGRTSPLGGSVANDLLVVH